MTVGRDAAAGEEGRVSDSANWQRNCVHAKCGLWRGGQKHIRARARTHRHLHLASAHERPTHIGNIRSRAHAHTHVHTRR